MEVFWLVVRVTSISSDPFCETLTTAPVRSETYTKLCAEPLQVPAVCTPFLRYSSGVWLRTDFGRIRFKWVRTTAQVSRTSEFVTDSVAAADHGTSGFAAAHRSLR